MNQEEQQALIENQRDRILELKEEYENLHCGMRSVEKKTKYPEFNRGQMAIIEKVIDDLEELLK